jgi:hypothetical protein
MSVASTAAIVAFVAAYAYAVQRFRTQVSLALGRNLALYLLRARRA